MTTIRRYIEAFSHFQCCQDSAKQLLFVLWLGKKEPLRLGSQQAQKQTKEHVYHCRRHG